MLCNMMSSSVLLQISDQLASLIVAQLLFLQSDDPKKPIQMYLNSPGVQCSVCVVLVQCVCVCSACVVCVCVVRVQCVCVVYVCVQCVYVCVCVCVCVVCVCVCACACVSNTCEIRCSECIHMCVYKCDLTTHLLWSMMFTHKLHHILKSNRTLQFTTKHTLCTKQCYIKSHTSTATITLR